MTPWKFPSRGKERLCATPAREAPQDRPDRTNRTHRHGPPGVRSWPPRRASPPHWPPDPPPTRPTRAPRTATRRSRALISRMTLEEKVGQLFVMRVYGHSATAPDQADIDANLAEIGVRDGRRADRQVPRRRHHLLRLGAQHPRPAPDRRPVQRHPAGLAGPAARSARAHLHRPGARHSRPGRQARDAVPRRHGAGRGRLAGRRPHAGPRSPAPNCARSASARTTPPTPT